MVLPGGDNVIVVLETRLVLEDEEGNLMCCCMQLLLAFCLRAGASGRRERESNSSNTKRRRQQTRRLLRSRDDKEEGCLVLSSCSPRMRTLSRWRWWVDGESQQQLASVSTEQSQKALWLVDGKECWWAAVLLHQQRRRGEAKGRQKAWSKRRATQAIEHEPGLKKSNYWEKSCLWL